ncbi:hypothetical protein HMPREF9080_01413 [Cardiobacterium valvarum F0432]|uniref:Uncharacterized protein n=1 Tax=Cardiobacterium valvarum F0432 TaxID=797473 RepID=G9ZF58_9GAMM|nr:hypothetical protein HMPREF9080_01413 [Cardiobacterium valvarum F0432]
MIGAAARGRQVGSEQAAATAQCSLCRHDGRTSHAPAAGDNEQAPGIAFVREAAARAVLAAQPGGGEPVRGGGGIGEGVTVKVNGDELQGTDMFFVFLPEQRGFGAAETEGAHGADDGFGTTAVGAQAGRQVNGDGRYRRAVHGVDKVGVGSGKRTVQTDAIEGVNLDAACGRGVSGEVICGDEARKAGCICGVIGAGRAVLRMVCSDVMATQVQLTGNGEAVTAVVSRASDDGPVAVIGVVGKQARGAAAGGAFHEF